MRIVDAAVCAYGKPYQTAAAVLSLMEHSGHHIDRVYIQVEREQPHGDSGSRLVAWLQEYAVVHYAPPLFLGAERLDRARLADPKYRLSIRYQFAWEKTDKRFLFILHNDCLFTKNIVGGMLQRLDDQEYTGVGQIGQCWICPAHAAKVCNGDIHETYKPTYEEAARIFRMHPPLRSGLELVDRVSPCRCRNAA
jgi:hypothetical protein